MAATIPKVVRVSYNIIFKLKWYKLNTKPGGQKLYYSKAWMLTSHFSGIWWTSDGSSTSLCCPPTRAASASFQTCSKRQEESCLSYKCSRNVSHHQWNKTRCRFRNGESKVIIIVRVRMFLNMWICKDSLCWNWFGCTQGAEDCSGPGLAANWTSWPWSLRVLLQVLHKRGTNHDHFWTN